jgi:hypothetical protein
MAHQNQQGGPLGDLAVSLLRTGVPLIWGYVIAWAVSLGVSASFLAQFHDLAVNALGAVLTFAWYAAWRWAETKLPKLDSYAAQLAVVIALGHPKAPSYAPSVMLAPVPSATKAPPAA